MDVNLNKTKTQSQATRILAWMEQGNGITRLEALEKFGCIELPKRICEIQSRGFSVEKTWITTPTGKNVIRYSLKK